MYAVALDMSVSLLKENYGDPYNPAYDEIRNELAEMGFEWVQDSLYVYSGEESPLAKLYEAIDKLRQIEWFKNSVRDIRAFKVEDWSDFTEMVTGKKNEVEI